MSPRDAAKSFEEMKTTPSQFGDFATVGGEMLPNFPTTFDETANARVSLHRQ